MVGTRESGVVGSCGSSVLESWRPRQPRCCRCCCCKGRSRSGPVPSCSLPVSLGFDGPKLASRQWEVILGRLHLISLMTSDEGLSHTVHLEPRILDSGYFWSFAIIHPAFICPFQINNAAPVLELEVSFLVEIQMSSAPSPKFSECPASYF